MGNSNNLSNEKKKYRALAAKFGQLYIQIERGDYFAGDIVKGTVFLNLLQPYPGSTLYFRFKGREYIHWVELERRKELESRDKDPLRETFVHYESVHYEEKLKTHDVRDQLYRWVDREQIPPGQFSFPFSMVLPPRLAGTFFQKRYQLLADISYSLEAVLDPLTKSVQSPPKLKYKHIININELPAVSAEARCKNAVFPMTDCCCDKGSAKLYCQFEKNIYVPGEVASVQIQLDNRDSGLDCARIEFTLKQVVKLKPKKRKKTVQKDFKSVEAVATGVAIGQLGQSKTVSLVLPPPETDNLKLVQVQGNWKEDIEKKEENYKNMINPSTHGFLIDSDFILNVQCRMESTCCNTDPEMSIPITINAPALELTAIDPPVDWNPTMMKASNVSYGQASGGNINLEQMDGGNNINFGNNISYGNNATVNFDSVVPVNYANLNPVRRDVNVNMNVNANANVGAEEYLQSNQRMISLDVYPNNPMADGNQPLLAALAFQLRNFHFTGR